jgi:putative heme-binding domain-containing protein
VFPNRQIAQGYESSMITTRTGTVYAGVVKSEDDATLVVATPDEGDVRLAKAEVKSRERGVSGMPEGFGELLTRFELRDVVEFLGTLR